MLGKSWPHLKTKEQGQTQTNGVWGLCRDNSGEAVAVLAELTFLPQEQFRVRRCVEASGKLHSAVAALLAPAVAAAGRALASQVGLTMPSSKSLWGQMQCNAASQWWCWRIMLVPDCIPSNLF